MSIPLSQTATTAGRAMETIVTSGLGFTSSVPVQIQVTSIESLALGGGTLIKGHQSVYGHPVKGTGITLHQPPTGLPFVVGQLFPLRRTPPPPPSRTVNASARTKRVFDPVAGQWLDIEETARERIIRRASTGRVLRRRPSRSVDHFTPATTGFEPRKSSASNAGQFRATAPIFATSPTFEDADDTSNGSTCRRELDNGTDFEDLQPKVEVCDGTSTTGCTTYEVDVDCTSNEVIVPFGGTSTTSRFAFATTLFVVISEIGDVFRADHVPYPWNEAENLRVAVLDETPEDKQDAAAWASGGWLDMEYTAHFPRDRSLSIRTVAHELGHIVHKMQSYYGAGGRCEDCLKEGYADFAPLRYALSRPNPSNTWDEFGIGTSGYDTPYIGDWYLVSSKTYNGVFIPFTDYYWNEKFYPYQGFLDDGGVTRVPCSAAYTDHPNNLEYECGSIVSVLFWQLAWDVARSTFRIGPNGPLMNAGDQICSTSGCHASARSLAIAAFAYAIHSMPSSGGMQEFFELVLARYQQWQAAGSITAVDTSRVQALLDAHCAIGSADCGEQYGTVGHPRNLARVKTSEFSDGTHEAFAYKPAILPRAGPGLPAFGSIEYEYLPDVLEELVRAEDMTTIGTPATGDHLYGLVPSQAGLGALTDSPKKQFVTLQQTGDGVEFVITLPSTGVYEFDFAVAIPWRSTASIRVSVRDGSTVEDWYYQDLDTTRTGAELFIAEMWNWFRGDHRAQLTGGTKTIRITHHDAEVDLDAVVVRRVGDCADADGDTICDTDDACPNADDRIQDPDRDGICGSNDLCPNRADICGDPTCSQPDADGDGVGDACDPCILTANATGPDVDNDRVCEPQDNCPGADEFNPTQLDTDGDGKGNICDDDDDGDNIPDASDNCPLVANASQDDVDGDGVGSECDCDDSDPTNYSDCILQSDVMGRLDGIAAFFDDQMDWTTGPFMGWSAARGCLEVPCSLSESAAGYADASVYFENGIPRATATTVEITEIILMDEEISYSFREVHELVEESLVADPGRRVEPLP